MHIKSSEQSVLFWAEEGEPFEWSSPQLEEI